MPTQLGDPASKDLSQIYWQWLQNLGVNTPNQSRGLGELLSAIASAAAGQSAQGTTDLSPTNTVSANLARSALSSQTVAVASGTLQLEALYLTKGQVVNTINYASGSTAAVTPTHQWGVIATSARVVVAATADALAGAIGTNAVISYNLTTPYTVPATGIYYVGVVVVAGTPPTFAGATLAATVPASSVPILGGTSNTGIAGGPVAVGTTLTAITTTAGIVYFYLT